MGALSNLGYEVCDNTIGNVLKRNGIPTAPDRERESTWTEFIKSHQDVIAACDFFTAEVLTPVGLMTYYVLFFIHIGSREIHIAGATINPDENWMKQIARNVTMAGWGFLKNCKYLIHDRDSKICDSFRWIIKTGGVKPLKLPAKSPNSNPIPKDLFGQAIILPPSYHKQREPPSPSYLLHGPATPSDSLPEPGSDVLLQSTYLLHG